jgi:hypothetical protein
LRKFYDAVQNSLICTIKRIYGQNLLTCTTFSNKKRLFEQNPLICTIILHILGMYRAKRAFWLRFSCFTWFSRAFERQVAPEHPALERQVAPEHPALAR